MQLTREDLEHISSGQFSKLITWQASDMDPNRVIIPAPPYLFMYEVIYLDQDHIRYRCHPDRNPLLQECDTLPAGIALEFFQGYMVLADWMGYAALPQNSMHRIHRALGGKFEYVAPLPSIHNTLDIDIRITKVTKFGKTTILQYQGEMSSNGQTIIRIKDFSGIFYEKGTAKSGNVAYIPQETSPVQTLPSTIQTKLRTYDTVDVYSEQYLEGIRAIDPKEWCFNCHFVNDPCMPGSFLFQAFFDIMSQYLGRLVQPVSGQEILSSAKLHVLPSNKELRLCIAIKERESSNPGKINCLYTIYVDNIQAFSVENITIV